MTAKALPRNWVATSAERAALYRVVRRAIHVADYAGLGGYATRGYYWHDYSWARVFNDNPYDRLRGYTNANLTLIFTNQNGWQVMLYDKNIFNTTDITGAFLNSDDSGLTTNVFLTDPRLIGIRVTKNW